MSEQTTGQRADVAMKGLVEGASDECKEVVRLVLKLERDHLLQKNPSKAQLAREIAGIVRKTVA